MLRTILAVGLLFGGSLVAATHVAAHDSWALSTLVSVVGQAPTAGDAAREQTTDLLSRARQAMAEGNLETADSLLTRAEGMNVAYGLFHTGDTPKKARRDWERLRQSRSGGAAPKADPFAGQPGALPQATPAAAKPIAASALSTPPAYPSAMPAAPAAFPAGPSAAITPLPAPAVAGDVRLVSGTEPVATAAFVNGNGAPAPANTAQFIPAPLGASVAAAATPVPPAVPTLATVPAEPTGGQKQQVLDLVKQSREAFAAGDLARAEQLARDADALGVSDKEFGPQDDRPWLVLMEVEKVRRRGGVQPTAVAAPAGPAAPQAFPGSQAMYDSNNDATRNIPAAAEMNAAGLITAGEEALRQRDPNGAMNLFRQAEARRGELTPAEQQRLQDRMSLVTFNEPIAPGRAAPGTLIDQTAQAQELLTRQIMADVAKLESQAEQAQGSDPAAAQAALQQARVLVEKSTLAEAPKQMLLRRVDRKFADLEKFVETNRPKIELEQRNQEVRDTLDRESQAKLELQERLAQLVDEYNTLVDQQRFAEAEVLAKRAAEMAPNEQVAVQLQAQSKSLRRMFNNADIRGLREQGTIDALTDIDNAGIINVGDGNPMQFPKDWASLKARRLPFLSEGARRSPKELEIEQRLKTPVSLKFDKLTMAQVFEKLSAMTGVPIYLDQRGLAAEGIDSTTPVSIDLTSEISLKSALNILLANHHLTYVIKDEVLKITSERMRSEDVYTVTYPVGDLVIPIPNFVPTSKMGLSGALAEAHASAMGGGVGMGSGAMMPVMASTGKQGLDASTLGQVTVPYVAGGSGGPPTSGSPQNIGFGPGGMGGGVQPDFDSLIELITSTIRQQDWQDNGGTIGFIRSHDTTLSLVITHDVRGHEEIENLLTQLRKLQDLQVTIEVRFITLNDAFYEQVGVDFDLDIDDNIDAPFQVFGRSPSDVSTSYTTGPLGVGSGNPPRDVQDRDHGKSATVGMSAPGVFSSDLDIPFTQSSLAQAAGAISNAVPAVTLANGLAPGGAQVGFAILSDLEAYFFINAVQDDQRSNVLQAPKVTMFNGQQAFVSDTQQTPFVISVVPVVGDFAAAQQPVIVVLNEGTSLSVQAVVSNDRRFVRLTMVPFFSQIGEVNTFTFEGSSSTTRRSSSETQGPDEEAEADEEVTSNSGTTVQLPTFAFQTVTTTVSVPDVGTVLLGGIKRMREARYEDGVPMLNKIPYVNRLFNNVAIGKSSTSLMMMVTPRIIIQEEEEAAIGVTQSP